MGIVLEDNKYETQNGVIWRLGPISKKVLTKIKISSELNIDQLPITATIYFTDDVWDFNEFNLIGKCKKEYIFVFSQIENIYKDFLKNMILKELVIYERSFSTVQGKFGTIKTFINYLHKNKIEHLELLDFELVKRYLNRFKQVSMRRVSHIKNALRLFFDEIQNSYFDFNLESIYKELTLTNVELRRLRAEMENNVFEMIPITHFKKIVSLAVKDINKFRQKLDSGILLTETETYYAISACLITILAETGMRIGEAHKLEIDRLGEIKSDYTTTLAHYLNFITYKTTPYKDGYLTNCYMSNTAVHAYNSLVNFTKERREKTDSKYLILNRNGKQYSCPSTVSRLIIDFFTAHQNDIDFYIMSKDDKEKFKYKKTKEGGFYYVTSHQFRVTCATRLYQKGKSLDWIMRHMNHMTDTMTQHYIRISELEKNTTNRIAEGIMIRASNDGRKIEIDPSKVEEPIIQKELMIDEVKKSYEAMNRFIDKVEKSQNRKLNLKIYGDVNEIIEIARQNTAFITDMELGFCVSSFIKICDNQPFISSSNDKIYDNLPKIHDLFAIEYNYKRFREKSEIIKANKRLIKENNRFRNEYQKELIGMRKFVEKIFLPELNLLKLEVNKFGLEYVIEKYTNVKQIVKNISKIEKEATKWITVI